MGKQQNNNGNATSNNTGVKTILILAANPTNTSRLRLDEEVREIEEGLRRANKREQFTLEQKWAVRSRDFYRAILDYQPLIVHFCGHGAGVDGIVLEDEVGQPALVSADILAGMFEVFNCIECVVLNACFSKIQAEAISQHTNYVIGMSQALGDKAAIKFAVAFYDAIAAGQNVESAFNLSRAVLVSLGEQLTPELKKRTDIVPTKSNFIPPNPYQGLFAFSEKDAELFFGRENVVDSLVDVVHKQPLVAVIGSSGSGKSSTIFAGLIPRLRLEDTWLIESFRPSSQPFFQLASTLIRLLDPQLGEARRLIDASELAVKIQSGKLTLPEVLSSIVGKNYSTRLLLVVDQFEELYSLCQDKEEQQHFVDLLLEAVNQKNLTLVLTLRSDFFDYLVSYPPFGSVLQEFKPQVLISMSREELKTAIEKPAQKLNVQIERGLTERILNDVGNEPGNLPLLEFALTELWKKQQNYQLTHEAYNEIGEVKRALVKHAENVYSKFRDSEHKQAQRIFLSLVRIAEETGDARRVATRNEIGQENWELVTFLAGAEARLVVTGRNEKTGEETVEVVHEALIREWNRLRDWLDNNREKLIQQRKIEAGAIEWRDKGKSKDYLLGGKQLNEAKVFQKEQATLFRLSGLASELIQKSIKYRRNNHFSLIGFGVINYLAIIGSLVWLSTTPYIFNKERYSQGERSFYISNDENSGLLSGIEEFNQKHFPDAEKFFKRAIDANPNDPEVLIYYNNAKAWGRGHPFTLAVAIPLDKKRSSTMHLLRGVALAQQEFNSNPKNTNRLLNIMLARDNDDAKQAKEVAQELIKDQNVIGVIGHTTSISTKSALPEYQKAPLAIISSSSSSTELGDDSTELKNYGFFRTIVTDRVVSKKLADFAIKHNIKRVAIFYENNPHGRSSATEFKKEFKNQGGEIVRDPIDLKKLEPDYSPIVKDIVLKDKADAVIFCTNQDVYDIVTAIVQARNNLPILKKLKLMAGDGLYPEKILQKSFEGLILAPVWFEKEGNGEEKEFTKKAAKKWSGHIDWSTATSYDATKAFITAISMSDNPDRETVLKNLESVRLKPNETSGDELNFSPSNHERENKLSIVKVVESKYCSHDEKFCFKIVKEK